MKRRFKDINVHLTMASQAMCVLVVFSLVITGENVSIKKFFGKVGDTVTFGPENVDSEITSFTWDRPEPSPSRVVAERDEGEKDLYVPNPTFKNHVTVNFTTGYITLTSLQVDFSGTYTVRINSYSTDNQFILTVKNPVTKPQIKLDITTNAVYLQCDADEKINWTSSAEKPMNKYDNGKLTVVLNNEDPATCYTCTTYNEVSSSTSESVCVKDFLPGSGIDGAVVAGIVIVGILVPLLLLFFLLYIFYDPFRDEVKNRTGSCCTKYLVLMDDLRKNCRKVEGEGAQTEEQKANVPLNKKVSDNVENGEDQ